tara:strand:+ start:1625 stop:2245 length:621 start_codon:yes stop_codon:yes gene_type:complete
MELEFGYWYFQKIFNKKFCNKIIKHALKKKQKTAITGQKERKKISNKDLKDLKKQRNSNIVWLDDQWIYDEIHPYVDNANRSAKWNYHWDWSEKCQFTIYSKDQHYDWHKDMFAEPNQKPGNGYNKVRKLSTTILLNDTSEYSGGEFEFYFNREGPNKKRKIIEVKELTSVGSMIVFPSFTWHRVKPITKGVRYSLVIWHNGSPFL